MSLTRPLTRSLTSPLTRALTGASGGGDGSLSPPSDFGWTPPIKIYRSVGGVYSTNFNPAAPYAEGDAGVTTIYVDAATGNDGNAGTSALPKKTLTAASAPARPKLLIKARGTFVVGPLQATLHDNLVVQSWGGADLIITNEITSVCVWTDETGGTWSCPPPASIGSPSNNLSVYSGTDLTTLNVRYALAASLVACKATPGTYFRDTTAGIKHYVHTLTGTSPATGHTVFAINGSAQAINLSAKAFDQNIYFSGVTFIGGDGAMVPTGHNVYTKNFTFVLCKYMHGSNFAAYHSTGRMTAIHYQCTAGPTSFDGFSSHKDLTYNLVPGHIEIECTGNQCGITGTANQGSTTHEGGKIIRINGVYSSNQNDQVADVNVDTRSWNLGCTFGPKRTNGYPGVTCGNDGGLTKTWLDGCTFTGVDVCVRTAAPAVLYYRNMAAPATFDGDGTITTY